MANELGWRFQPFQAVPWAAGVDVFFVISGFIIVHASRNLFEGPGAGRIFLTRRIARIAPLYWTATTLYLAVALIAPDVLNRSILEPGFVLASYLFIPLARPDGLAQPLYSLGWTLNYEMYFYLLFALVIFLPMRKAVIGLAAALAVAVALGRLAPLPQPLAFWTDPIVLEFAFGMVLALLKAEGFALSRGLRAVLVAVGLLLLLGAAQAGLPRAVGFGVPAALFVAAAALGSDRVRPTTWLTQAASALGDASYALYLIHPFVIRAGREILVKSGLASVIGPWGYVLLATAGAVVASLMVFRWYERPVTEWVRQRLEPARLRLA
jgi:peptidoglycan/LPS O-acetylase OafA/YrhL